MGIPFLLLGFCQAAVAYEVRTSPGVIPLPALWAVLGEYALYPIALIPLLFLLYPNGHVPSPRWRWAVRGLIGGLCLRSSGSCCGRVHWNNWVEQGILWVNPLGIDALEPVGGVLIAIGAIVALVSALSTAIAVIQRFRRSTGEQRQQMRWLALVGAVAAISFALNFAIGIFSAVVGIGENDDSGWFVFFLAITALTLVLGTPAAYLIAIYRYGLWDLDLVIRKTLQYVVLVVAFMLLGFLIVAVVPALVLGVGSGTSIVPTLALAGVLTGVFLWLRPKASRLANRLVYGKRATPYEVLSEFSERGSARPTPPMMSCLAWHSSSPKRTVRTSACVAARRERASTGSLLAGRRPNVNTDPRRRNARSDRWGVQRRRSASGRSAGGYHARSRRR